MKKLDVYLADLMVLNVKFHNWHWNVEGFTFKAVHEYLEALYNDVFEKYDEIAEYQKMTGTCPNASLKEYLAITGVKEIESKKVTCEEAIVAAKKELEYLRDSAHAIHEPNLLVISFYVIFHFIRKNEVISLFSDSKRRIS